MKSYIFTYTPLKNENLVVICKEIKCKGDWEIGRITT